MTILDSKNCIEFINAIDANEIINQVIAHFCIVLDCSKLIKHYRQKKIRVLVHDFDLFQTSIFDTKS